MRSLSLPVLCLLPVLLSAQMLYTGPCPVHPLEDDFDVQRYAGSWFEINRTLAFFELGYSCVSADYAVDEEGKITLVNKGQNFMDAVVAMPGKAMVPDPRRPAKLMVKIGRVPFWQSYMVLSTDYDNYALVWNCMNLGYLLHTEILWVLSRQRTLDPEHRTEIQRFIRQNRINTRTMQGTKQTSCLNLI